MVIEDRLGTVRLRKVEAVVDLQTLADRLYGSKRERERELIFKTFIPCFWLIFQSLRELAQC